MKNVIPILLVLLIGGIIVAGCGGDKDGERPSAKSQLDKLQPADVSNPEILADSVGTAVAMSQMGMEFSGGFDMGMMNAVKSLRIPVLKGSRLGTLQMGDFQCSEDPNHYTCTGQCEISGSVTLECSRSQSSGTCKMTFNNCKESTDEPAANGSVQIDAKGDSSGNLTITMTIDVTAGKGFVYGSYNITLSPAGTGATIKQTMDITGADDSDPTDVGYIYFDETITMKDLGNYEFNATINGNGAFGTTKQGKVSVAINNVVIDPSACWMEPVSGTITVSAGGSSVTVTFDGGSGGGTPPAGCDGKVQCSGAYTGEIDITGASEPAIEF